MTEHVMTALSFEGAEAKQMLKVKCVLKSPDELQPLQRSELIQSFKDQLALATCP